MVDGVPPVTWGDKRAAAQLLFEQLRLRLFAGQAMNKAATSAIGWVGVVLAAEVVVNLNLGNPFEFEGAADHWADPVALGCTTTWTNIEQGYANNCAGDWTGDASQAFNAYVTVDLKQAAEALNKLAEALATGLSAVAGAIEIMDVACLLFTVGSAIFLNALLGAYAASMGALYPAMAAATTAYIVGLVGWIGALANLLNAFVQQTRQVEIAANQLKAKLWADTQRRQTRIALSPNLQDYTRWNHNSALDG